MKKIIYLLLCVVFFATACEEFLKETPKSTIAPQTFYNSEQDALTAVNGAYAALQPDGYYGRYWITSSVHASDGGMTRLGLGGDRGAIIHLVDADMIESDRYNIQVWAAIWEAVNRTNAVLDNVPDIDFSDATYKARIIAEAKFLRALSYFNMVRRWGGVPLILHETTTSKISDLQIERNTVEEVYAQIEKDLGDAIVDLPLLSDYSGLDIGRASKEAAQGLLAKVNLYRKDWTDAKTNAEAVINSASNLKLMNEPKDLWWESSNRDNNSESIFEIQYNGDQGNNGHALANNFEPRNNGWGPGQWGSIHANFHFYNKFSDKDKRKAATFLTTHPEKNTDTIQYWWNFAPTPAHSPHIAKHREPENSVRCTYNIRVLRLADVLLIAAEANNELTGPDDAYDFVNRVRTRAGLGSLSGLTKEAMRDSIYLEFRRELCFEGQDYEELVRTGRLISEKTASATYVIPTLYGADSSIHIPTKEELEEIERFQPQKDLFEFDEHNTLFPIPLMARDKNPKLTQNPGY